MRAKNYDGILDGKNKTDEMPSQIHAQLDAIDGKDGNLHTLDPQAQAQTTCAKCGITGDPFWMKVHLQNCEGEGEGEDEGGGPTN